jgi:hypothetical protein
MRANVQQQLPNIIHYLTKSTKSFNSNKSSTDTNSFSDNTSACNYLSIKNDELNVTNKDLIQKEGKNKRREKINTIKAKRDKEEKR